MKELNYTIKDELGIHARPAGLLVKEVAKFKSDIKVFKNEKSVDAKRLIAVMSLGVKCGENIVIKAEGEDEDLAIEAIKKFLEENL